MFKCLVFYDWSLIVLLDCGWEGVGGDVVGVVGGVFGFLGEEFYEVRDVGIFVGFEGFFDLFYDGV